MAYNRTSKIWSYFSVEREVIGERLSSSKKCCYGTRAPNGVKNCGKSFKRFSPSSTAMAHSAHKGQSSSVRQQPKYCQSNERICSNVHWLPGSYTSARDQRCAVCTEVCREHAIHRCLVVKLHQKSGSKCGTGRILGAG